MGPHVYVSVHNRTVVVLCDYKGGPRVYPEKLLHFDGLNSKY